MLARRARPSVSQRTRSALRAVFPIDEDPLGGSVKIFVLATPQRPQEAAQAKRAKEEGDRDEVGKGRHEDWANSLMSDRLAGRTSFASELGTEPCKRSALPMTSSDEADMAIAAIKGVTCPRIAIGTATAL